MVTMGMELSQRADGHPLDAATGTAERRLIMADYIEREATIKLLRSLGSRDYRREKGTIQEAIKMVSFPEYTPSADVVPMVHGQWETSSDRPDSLICSVCKCGFDMWKHDPHNFCPNCGAKMDGGAE